MRVNYGFAKLILVEMASLASAYGNSAKSAYFNLPSNYSEAIERGVAHQKKPSSAAEQFKLILLR